MRIRVLSSHTPGTSGGFHWFGHGVPMEDCIAVFESEVVELDGDMIVRLVEVDVPDELYGRNDAITEYIDADIDAIEGHLPAIRFFYRDAA